MTGLVHIDRLLYENAGGGVTSDFFTNSLKTTSERFLLSLCRIRFNYVTGLGSNDVGTIVFDTVLGPINRLKLVTGCSVRPALYSNFK